MPRRLPSVRVLDVQPREVCLRCRRPASACYCAHLPRLETRTRVVILQHPRERDVAIGTARMASLCLPGAALHVGAEWGEHAGLAAALRDDARPPILLYPGPGARDILREPPPGPVTLIVVDGTWSQAKVVVRDNPVLAALPRYAFAAPEASEYRIRREPHAEYVSTIEALMHVLGALEGDAARFRALLAPFRAMVEHQLAYQGKNLRQRHPKPPRPPRVPAELAGDVVCLVGEANAWPYRDGDHDRGGDELVHLAAHRIATGETFSFVVAPAREISPTTSFHTGLSEDTLRAGGTRAALDVALADFVRPSDIVCVWGHHATNLYRDAGGHLPRVLDLRAAAQRLHHAKLGTLERYAVAMAPAPTPPLCEGRAGRRLAMLRDIVTAWRSLGSGRPPSPRS
jgi:DTW domain-containing protein YfiP